VKEKIRSGADFVMQRTCKVNDRAARKHPKHVPDAEICIKVNILDSDFIEQHKKEEAKA